MWCGSCCDSVVARRIRTKNNLTEHENAATYLEWINVRARGLRTTYCRPCYGISTDTCDTLQSAHAGATCHSNQNGMRWYNFKNLTMVWGLC